MKTPLRTQEKMKSRKVHPVTSRSSVVHKKGATKSVPSPLVRAAKRHGKLALRSMLLSPVFHATFRIIVGIAVSGVVLHGAYMAISRTFADDVVVSQSEIVARIAKLTDVPAGVTPDDIVRVQDPESLRKQNAFYADIKEGDYIVMYPKLAVIYDLRNNSIVAVKKMDK
jgi:hypothetical protein